LTASKKYGLDPLYVSAVIWVESSGQTDIINPDSGATGLMQIMPSDGKAGDDMCINGLCYAGRPTTKELQDPLINIDYGCRMLADFIQREGGLKKALLYGYNPGGGQKYVDDVMAVYDSYKFK
jgi:soluble lytic murein transglycosylase-like protein